MKIGYFGEESSHTYACAVENFPGARLVGYNSHLAATQAVERGEVDGAVIPIENSVGGSVGECLDAIKKCGVYIAAEYLRPISHSLIAKKGADKGKITKIYSHPQAIAQCDGYLKAHFSDALVVAVSSTSEALKTVKDDCEAALARTPIEGLEVLEADVQDAKNNTTRFVFVRSTPTFNGTKVSVMFDIHHRPGELLKVLNVLADNDLNMTKLESRPNRDHRFEYWFYVEFECAFGKDKLMQVMARLTDTAGFIKFAGCY